MNYFCYTIASDTIKPAQWAKLCDFVNYQLMFHTAHPAGPNMGMENNAGLLNNIHLKKRWTQDTGEIAILEYQDRIVGVSCVEKSQLHQRLSIGGIRCWLDADHRNNNQVTRYLLAANLQWSIKHNASSMLLTFNDYNKIIYDAICKKTAGKAAGLGGVWSNWWNDCIALDTKLNIRFTEQWCVLKPIDLSGTQQIIRELRNHG